MTTQNTEFKFPDEIKEEVKDPQEEKLEIEVVDDTPVEDQNRTPMKEAPTEVTEDELNQYSDGVKKRIQHFTKGYHDERRAKEAAEREKEEAITLANKLVEENKRLQGSLSQGQTALLDQAKKVVEGELENAKRAYKTAHEAGDSDALLVAQEQLTTAKIKADRLNNYRAPPLQQTETQVQPQQTQVRPQAAPVVDQKAEAWRKANPWFGADDEMTAVALAMHRKLVQSNVDTTSDTYYDKINSRVRELFPSSFEDADTSSKAAKTVTKPANVVASATRSTAPRKIVLTQTQVNIAKRLGVPLELYAKQVAKEMNKNG
jgi:hypothetical protein